MNSPCLHTRKVVVDASSAILLFKTGLFESLMDTYAVRMANKVYETVNNYFCIASIGRMVINADSV